MGRGPVSHVTLRALGTQVRPYGRPNRRAAAVRLLEKPQSSPVGSWTGGSFFWHSRPGARKIRTGRRRGGDEMVEDGPGAVWLLDVDGVLNANRPGWGGPPRGGNAQSGGDLFRIRWAPALV